MEDDDEKTDGLCKLCNKSIDDHGELFCSKCRDKSFEERFKCIQDLEKGRQERWKSKIRNKLKEGEEKSYDRYYWNRRRGK